MKSRWLLYLYPRAWRERYGDEFIALLEAGPVGVHLVVDVLKSAGGEWVGAGRVHAPQALLIVRSLVGYYCAGHLLWWGLSSSFGGGPHPMAWTPTGLVLSAAIQARAAAVALTIVFLIGWVLMGPYPTSVRSRLLDWMGLIALAVSMPVVMALEHAGVGPSREVATRFFGETVVLWAAAHCFTVDWAVTVVRRWTDEPERKFHSR